MPKTVMKLKKTLTEASSQGTKQPPPNYDLVQSKVTLQALGITIGEKVMVGGVKVFSYHYWIVFFNPFLHMTNLQQTNVYTSNFYIEYND